MDLKVPTWLGICWKIYAWFYLWLQSIYIYYQYIEGGAGVVANPDIYTHIDVPISILSAAGVLCYATKKGFYGDGFGGSGCFCL